METNQARFRSPHEEIVRNPNGDGLFPAIDTFVGSDIETPSSSSPFPWTELILSYRHIGSIPITPASAVGSESFELSDSDFCSDPVGSHFGRHQWIPDPRVWCQDPCAVLRAEVFGSVDAFG